MDNDQLKMVTEALQYYAALKVTTADGGVQARAALESLGHVVHAPPRATDTIDKMLSDHLRMWKSEIDSAPVNELQSIAAWLRYLGEHGQEKTKNTMRQRMLLLMKAAGAIHEGGPEMEDACGIYDSVPRPVDPAS
jgi:hypothetical protein